MNVDNVTGALRVRGRILTDVKMDRYSSWRVGGRAQTLFIPEDREDLLAFLASGRAVEPINFIGLGSNLLVRDGGVDGTMIRLSPGLAGVNGLGGEAIRAEAGLAAPKLAKFAAQQGLTGIEFMVGIPGSVGGALAMNAGCFGSTTWETVASVEVVTPEGSLLELPAEEFEAGYRSLRHPRHEQLYFLAARFQLKSGAASADVKEIMAKRSASQPIGTANAGSVFINPPSDSAGRLIEASNLAGTKVGDAEVSTKHCNFIINRGASSATEIEDLIEQIRAKVKQDSGVELETEVRILGERA